MSELLELPSGCMCEEYHWSALDLFLNCTKSLDFDGTCE